VTGKPSCESPANGLVIGDDEREGWVIGLSNLDEFPVSRQKFLARPNGLCYVTTSAFFLTDTFLKDVPTKMAEAAMLLNLEQTLFVEPFFAPKWHSDLLI